MCGICGIIGRHEGKEDIIQRMMNRIYHRGPDDGGSYVKGDAALGFRRLSIIDLETGAQPMYNETNDIVIVFNGEIYNYEELRRELIEKGHVFRTKNSDTECLIHAYEEYKEGMLSHLRGMFAFAIWDEKEQTLFAARDFFGIKPFYYGVIDGNLVFSSEIKAILEFPEYHREVNTEALSHYLSFQYSVMEETFFKGIRQLCPGTYLKYKEGNIELFQYWDSMLTPQKKQKEEDAVAQIHAVMEDSIQKHQFADVEVGTLLSGGVDSNYVLMKSHVDKAFTVGFAEDSGKYSEIQYAEEMAKAKGVEHYKKVITAEEYWDVLPKVMYYMDEPLADPSAVALYFVDELARKHLKAVLSGEGSDELFGGYNIYHEPLSLRPFKILPKGAKRVLRKFAVRHSNIRGMNYIRRGCTPLEQRFIGNAYMFTRREKARVLAEGMPVTSPEELTKSYYEKTKGLDDVARMQYIDLNFWLRGDILLKADRMSMANAVESRVPFLDKEVFYTARNLSMNNKVRGKVTKLAFRKAAREVLPEFTAQKKKLGFPVPVRVWLREKPYYERVKSAFTSEDAAKFFQTKYLMKLLDEHYQGKKDNSRKVWCIYIFLVWYQVYFCGKEKDIQLNQFDTQ